MEELISGKYAFCISLSEESHAAGKIKKNTTHTCYYGQPAIFGHSTNIGKWITDLIEDYKYFQMEQHFGERNPMAKGRLCKIHPIFPMED